MRLGIFSYFFDFLFAPAAMLLLAWRWPPAFEWDGAPLAGAAFVIGVFVWTLLEYAIHRWLFHRGSLLRRLHDFHHEKPDDLFGAPPIVGPVLILMAFEAPALYWGAGSGWYFTAGVLAGYLAYVLVHFDAHARLSALSLILGAARRRHMRHHFASGAANFGIVTGLWDVVFRTSRTEATIRSRVSRASGGLALWKRLADRARAS